MKIGIDLGSRKAKFALLQESTIVRLADYDTITFYKRFGSLDGADLSLDLEGSGLFSSGELVSAEISVTGYGRNSLRLKGAHVVSEIRAHVAGAIFQSGLKNFTMLDMEGRIPRLPW